MAKIRFEKEGTPLVLPLPGTSNADFYGYAFADGMRVGIIDRFKDTGRYRFVPDYDRRAERRRDCKFAPTLRDLKAILEVTY